MSCLLQMPRTINPHQWLIKHELNIKIGSKSGETALTSKIFIVNTYLLHFHLYRGNFRCEVGVACKHHYDNLSLNLIVSFNILLNIYSGVSQSVFFMSEEKFIWFIYLDPVYLNVSNILHYSNTSINSFSNWLTLYTLLWYSKNIFCPCKSTRHFVKNRDMLYNKNNHSESISTFKCTFARFL